MKPNERASMESKQEMNGSTHNVNRWLLEFHLKRYRSITIFLIFRCCVFLSFSFFFLCVICVSRTSGSDSFSLRARTHTRAHTRARTHTRAHTYTRTHTYIHTYTHTHASSSSSLPLSSFFRLHVPTIVY